MGALSSDDDWQPILLNLSQRPHPPAVSVAPTSMTWKIGAVISLIGKLFLLGTTLFTPIVLYSALNQYWVLHSWMRTTGEVKATRLLEQVDNFDHGPVRHTKFLCTVAFAVNGRPYASEIDLGENDPKMLRSLLAERSQMIVYDPQNPNRIRFAGNWRLAYLETWGALRLAIWLWLLTVVLIWIGRLLSGQTPGEEIPIYSSF